LTTSTVQRQIVGIPKVPVVRPFVPFSEFPSPALLAEAQRWFHAAGSPIPGAGDKLPGPFPPRCTKEELLESRDLAQIDLYAQQVLQLLYMYILTRDIYFFHFGSLISVFQQMFLFLLISMFV
jgi:hypothetical protein